MSENSQHFLNITKSADDFAFAISKLSSLLINEFDAFSHCLCAQFYTRQQFQRVYESFGGENEEKTITL